MMHFMEQMEQKWDDNKFVFFIFLPSYENHEKNHGN